MPGALIGSLLVAGLGLPAVSDLIQVERKQDRRGRAAACVKLAGTRVDFHATAMPIADAATFLTGVMGGAVQFVYLGRDRGTPAEPTLTLHLDRIAVPDLMGVIGEVTDLAFVYRNGVIMLMPAAEVKEETELVVYDLRAATAPLSSFTAPRIGELRPSNHQPDEDVEDVRVAGTISGFAIEDIERIVRDNVPLANWDADGVHLSSSNGLLIVRQTERGHAQVRAVLRSLGVG